MKTTTDPFSRRAEILHLYQRLASGEETMPVQSFLRFLEKQNTDLTVTEEMAERLIDRYEIEATGKSRETYAPCKDACCSLLQVEI